MLPKYQPLYSISRGTGLGLPPPVAASWPERTEQRSYEGSPARLAALRRGELVDNMRAMI